MLRHTEVATESCCLPALTRFAVIRCAGPGPGLVRIVGPRRSLGRPRFPRRLTRGATGTRRSARAAESARLEIVCPARDRGFKSHLLRRVDDHDAMGAALNEAARAEVHGDVPIGAICLLDGQVVASRHNERELRQDPTAHAELLAMADAAAATGSWRLEGATVIVTVEPCAMCAGALVAARVRRVVFGAADPKAGACGSLYNICADPRMNHEVAVTAGVRAAEAAALLRDFFAMRRG